jgi:hypothetical protein
MIQEKNHSCLGFKAPSWVHHQSIMFDPPFHKVTRNSHNTHISNPLIIMGPR